MQKLLLLILTFSICFAARAADEGKAAPELQAKLLNGENFSLSAVAGQVVLVHFWATWCEPCQVEMPILSAYYKKHHGDGLQLLAISMDKAKDEAKARALMKGFSFNAALAKEASFKAYGRIWRLPLTFLIDRKGVLRKDGWVTDHTLSADDLEKTVTPMLKEHHL